MSSPTSVNSVNNGFDQQLISLTKGNLIVEKDTLKSVSFITVAFEHFKGFLSSSTLGKALGWEWKDRTVEVKNKVQELIENEQNNINANNIKLVIKLVKQVGIIPQNQDLPKEPKTKEEITQIVNKIIKENPSNSQTSKVSNEKQNLSQKTINPVPVLLNPQLPKEIVQQYAYKPQAESQKDDFTDTDAQQNPQTDQEEEKPTTYSEQQEIVQESIQQQVLVETEEEKALNTETVNTTNTEIVNNQQPIEPVEQKQTQVKKIELIETDSDSSKWGMTAAISGIGLLSLASIAYFFSSTFTSPTNNTGASPTENAGLQTLGESTTISMNPPQFPLPEPKILIDGNQTSNAMEIPPESSTNQSHKPINPTWFYPNNTGLFIDIENLKPASQNLDESIEKPNPQEQPFLEPSSFKPIEEEMSPNDYGFSHLDARPSKIYPTESNNPEKSLETPIKSQPFDSAPPTQEASSVNSYVLPVLVVIAAGVAGFLGYSGVGFKNKSNDLPGTAEAPLLSKIATTMTDQTTSVLKQGQDMAAALGLTKTKKDWGEEKAKFDNNVQDFIKTNRYEDKDGNTAFVLHNTMIHSEYAGELRKDFVESYVDNQEIVEKIFRAGFQLYYLTFGTYVENFLKQDLETQKVQKETVGKILKNTSGFKDSLDFTYQLISAAKKNKATQITEIETQKFLEKTEREKLYDDILENVPGNLIIYLNKGFFPKVPLEIISKLLDSHPELVDQFVDKFCDLENYSITENNLKDFQQNTRIDKRILSKILEKRKSIEEKVINSPDSKIFLFDIKEINKKNKLSEYQLEKLLDSHQEYFSSFNPAALTETDIKGLKSYVSLVTICAGLEDKDMFKIGKSKLAALDAQLPFPHNFLLQKLARNKDSKELVSPEEIETLTKHIFQRFQANDPSNVKEYAVQSFKMGNNQQILDNGRAEFSKEAQTNQLYDLDIGCEILSQPTVLWLLAQPNECSKPKIQRLIKEYTKELKPGAIDETNLKIIHTFYDLSDKASEGVRFALECIERLKLDPNYFFVNIGEIKKDIFFDFASKAASCCIKDGHHQEFVQAAFEDNRMSPTMSVLFAIDCHKWGDKTIFQTAQERFAKASQLEQKNTLEIGCGHLTIDSAAHLLKRVTSHYDQKGYDLLNQYVAELTREVSDPSIVVDQKKATFINSIINFYLEKSHFDLAATTSLNFYKKGVSDDVINIVFIALRFGKDARQFAINAVKLGNTSLLKQVAKYLETKELETFKQEIMNEGVFSKIQENSPEEALEYSLSILKDKKNDDEFSQIHNGFHKVGKQEQMHELEIGYGKLSLESALIVLERLSSGTPLTYVKKDHYIKSVIAFVDDLTPEQIDENYKKIIYGLYTSQFKKQEAKEWFAFAKSNVEKLKLDPTPFISLPGLANEFKNFSNSRTDFCSFVKDLVKLCLRDNHHLDFTIKGLDLISNNFYISDAVQFAIDCHKEGDQTVFKEAQKLLTKPGNEYIKANNDLEIGCGMLTISSANVILESPSEKNIPLVHAYANKLLENKKLLEEGLPKEWQKEEIDFVNNYFTHCLFSGDM